jgi:hypothetical protein
MSNKTRGRAFQTKLAEMSGGMNIGTLGGEDVMHEEFSYEAKTYKKNCKTNKNKDWTGEKVLALFDESFAKSRFIVLEVRSLGYATIMLLRWHWWDQLLAGNLNRANVREAIRTILINKFKGNTYMNQAEKNCPDAKVPVAVVHTTGRRHVQNIVLIRQEYWYSVLANYLNKNIDK